MGVNLLETIQVRNSCSKAFRTSLTCPPVSELKSLLTRMESQASHRHMLFEFVNLSLIPLLVWLSKYLLIDCLNSGGFRFSQSLEFALACSLRQTATIPLKKPE